ncbi:hypothetical protein GQ457_02G040130 [Hibiscus cannabinus]
MGNLERLFADQLVEHSFSKLTSISLWDCPKLVNVFPLSMLTRLQRLERLEMCNCESVEEIVYEDGGDSGSSGGMSSFSPQFIQSDVEFPNLTSLVLKDLPNLKSIRHNKMHTINWSSLEKMSLISCHAVEIVFANSGETSSEQPLFWVNESTSPNLHKLTLGWNAGIKHIIWHGEDQQQHFISQYFPKLKVVRLEGYPKQVSVLPSYLLSLTNLQTLEIYGSSFKETIFQSEEGDLWKEKEGFPNLRVLHVFMCPELKVNLVPSSVTFRNLVTLKVHKCNGIIKLVTPSTAKSLVWLKQMSISNCENIQEIIQGGDDDDDDEISFPLLNSLELEDLPELESFCSSDKYSFGFPSLQFLLLQDCPKMKMFSQGHSNTPMLYKVRIKRREEEERWEGNTIQKLFREEVLTWKEEQDLLFGNKLLEAANIEALLSLSNFIALCSNFKALSVISLFFFSKGGASLLFPRIYSPLVLYFVLLLIIFSRERMEVIISIVGSLAAKAAEYTVHPIEQQLSYLFKPKTKFLNLRTKVQELKDARERVQQSVNSATRKGNVIFDDVQRWLTVVDKKISEEAATQLQDDEEKATKRCFAGFCPDFKSSYPLSKKADKEANAIAQLLTQRDNFDGVSRPSEPKGMDTIISVKEYEAFESRRGAFDGVMAALKDDALSIIGVYGMGGVGKTTLVKEAFKQAKEEQLFNEVILVAINQTPNMLNIQKEIAVKLGLAIHEENIDMRATRLHERLKKEGRVLVILDDIWAFLDLRALGIPSADEHKGCKILMTSRRLDVLKMMDSCHNISVETLKEDEARNLFNKMAGQIVERFDLQSIAVEIAKKCAGLPIAIATIAKALKPKENLYEWEDALRQLNNPSERNFEDIPGGAYSAIELSYKFLEVKELRPIFLLCSIMGHNAVVEDLLRYAIGLGFIGNVNTINENRNRVLTLINNLKASSLLLEGSHPNRFDMHDVVRDVAQSIVSRDLHWLALFKDCPDKKTMIESQLISLQNVEVSELLPHELDCPNLQYFSIGMKNYSPLKIAMNFFEGMQRLKVLEFNEINLTSLPSSIGSLKSLCTLRLRNCGLEDIAILGELGNLEILDFRGSRVKMLPNEMGQLTGLKLLDLSDCRNLEVISPNVLSKLSRLEELYLYYSFDKWEVEGIENPRSNGSLVELQHLSRLTTLEVHIPDVEAIPKYNLFFGKMERYKISIGDEKWHSYNDRAMKTSRMLKLKVNKSIHLVDRIKHLLRKTQSLYLNGMEDVEEMQMLYHPNVETIGQLRFIKVNNCNTMKNLFSFSIAKRLSQLEELEVSNCKNITVLIEEKEEIDDNDILEFNKLRILKLDKLNRFNGLWYSQNIPRSSAWLFDKKVKLPMLEELEIRGMENLKRLWGDQLVEHSFSKLTSIRLEGCPKLLNVFPLTRLQRLERLYVRKCESVEEIISEERGSSNSSSSSGMPSLSSQFIQSFDFPNLTSLNLWNLSNLKSIHHNKMHTISWPSLKEMIVGGCNRVEIMFANSGETSSQQPLFWVNQVNFPVLENLVIGNMDNLERLWADQLVEHSFSKLTSVELRSCPKLVNVFPLSMLTRLQRLESLEIWNCELIEEIISEGGGSNSSSGMPSLSPQFIQSFDFPNLTSLSLRKIPNLKSIHHNKMHTINWPSLKQMEVIECHRVEIVFANSEETSSEQPLFWVNESTFPNLHQLSLGWNAGIFKDIIWHGEGQQQQNFVSHYFPNLKVVKLEWYPEQVTVLPSYLFHLLTLPNLQTLEIRYSHFKEMIFQCEEGGEEKPASLLLSHITELRLDYLYELMHLWKEKEGFPNLRILHVLGCPGLQVNLVPFSVSFRNLVTLEVGHCDGIIKLITHSTAKSLVQLQQMRIANCKNIEQVIQGEDDDDEIGFPQLNSLKLEDLPKLESFCSSDKYTFGFPSLETLVVEDCPKMKMLSQGHSNTPMLHKVQLDTWSNEECWEGNLNSVVQKLFREKNLKKEVEDFVEDQDNYSTSNEDQSKPSTSNTQNPTAIMENSSTSNLYGSRKLVDANVAPPIFLCLDSGLKVLCDSIRMDRFCFRVFSV